MADISNPVAHDSEDLIDLQALISVFLRRLPLIISITSLTLFFSLITTLQLTPKYTSTVDILINNRNSQVLDFESVISDLSLDNGTIDTEVEVLNSRSLAGRVVDELNLTDNPEFNSSLQEPGFIKSLLSGLKGSLNLLRPSQVEEYSDDEDLSDFLVRENVITSLLNKVSIRRVGITYVIEVSVETESPRRSRDIANEYANQYLLSQLEAKFEATERANTWLNQRIESLREEVRVKEQAVAAYRAQEGLLDSEGSNLTEQQISDLNAQLVLQRAELAEAQARYNSVQSQIEQGVSADSIGEALRSAVVRDLRNQYSEAIRRRSELSTRYGPRHPQMLTVERELTDISEQLDLEVSRIVAGLRSEVTIARQRVSSMQNSLQDLQNELVNNNSSLIRLRELERDAASSRALFESFLNRFRETNETESLSDSDARVISEASLPTRSSSPVVGLNLALGFILGSVIAISVVIILELFDRGILTENEVEKETGLAYLTSIPSLNQGLVGRLKGDAVDPTAYVLQHPVSGFAEAYRTLRSSIRMANVDYPIRTVAITSAIPGEGKTTTALSLARISQMAGEKVVLLDCDIRRRRLSQETFEEAPKYGLLELLSTAQSLKEVIIKDPDSDVDIVPVTESKFTAQSIFESEAFANTLRTLKEQYSLVIIDTPPVMAVNDSRVIGRLVDGVVYTAKWGKTTPQLIKKATDILKSSHANIIGVILNDVNMKAQQKYGYSTNGYYYNSYSKYYTE